MRVQVDEARGDDFSRRIDGLIRRMLLQITDFGNLAILDPNVGLVTR